MNPGLPTCFAPVSEEVRDQDAKDDSEDALVRPDPSEGDKKWKENPSSQ